MNYNLKNIQELINSQDNLCTADPMFLVQRKHRMYGFNTSYTENNVWLYNDEAVEVPEDIAKQLEDGLLDENNYIYTGYMDIWEYVQCFFTHDAAAEFIKNNKHKYSGDELRIYVDSAYRNPEWKLVRNYLKDQYKEE